LTAVLAVDVSAYLAHEVLRDGRRLRVRALQPQDREAMLEAFGRTGEASRYTRFFSPKRGFTDREIDFFLRVDFTSHVALVAELEEAGRRVIVGGGRYIVERPGSAEVAFMVDDAHQGLGIGSLLMRHLVAIARAAGLDTLEAEVLAGNAAMLKVFERAGLALKTRREGSVLHLEMGLAAPTFPARSKS
jgi:RimJ/RimL family protein N-acetyltransferase